MLFSCQKCQKMGFSIKFLHVEYLHAFLDSQFCRCLNGEIKVFCIYVSRFRFEVLILENTVCCCLKNILLFNSFQIVLQEHQNKDTFLPIFLDMCDRTSCFFSKCIIHLCLNLYLLCHGKNMLPCDFFFLLSHKQWLLVQLISFKIPLICTRKREVQIDYEFYISIIGYSLTKFYRDNDLLVL